MPRNPTPKQRAASVINLAAARKRRQAGLHLNKLHQHIIWTDPKTGEKFPATRDFRGTTIIHKSSAGKRVKR